MSVSATEIDLIVDGRPVHPISSADDFYTLRFVALADGGHKPVLYHNGKRVIDAWEITLIHKEPQDTLGRSG
jgi:hypothetical protein